MDLCGTQTPQPSRSHFWLTMDMIHSSGLGLGNASSVSVNFSSSGVWHFTHVCRAGVCMCWHSPLVLLDEPANYFLNKTSTSSTHLYGNFISNFLRWKRNKNLQGGIISFVKLFNTDCRSCGMQRRNSLGFPHPYFSTGFTSTKKTPCCKKFSDFVLSKRSWADFVQQESTINKKKKIKHKKEKKNGSHPGRKLPSVW